MANNGRNISAKQHAAIAAMLAGQNLEQAASAAGVGYRTLYRWRKDPDFKAELAEQADGLIRDAVAALAGGAIEAIDTLKAVRDDPETPASVRVRAAQIWIDAALKLREHAELAERIEALEQRLAGQ